MAKRTDPLATLEALPHVADDQELQDLQARKTALQNQLVEVNDQIRSLDAQIGGHSPDVSRILQSGDLGTVMTDLVALENEREQRLRSRDAGEQALIQLDQMIEDRRRVVASELCEQARDIVADALLAVASAQVDVFNAQARLDDVAGALASKGVSPSDGRGLPSFGFFSTPWQAPAGVGKFLMVQPSVARMAKTWFVSAFAPFIPGRERELNKLDQ